MSDKIDLHVTGGDWIVADYINKFDLHRALAVWSGNRTICLVSPKEDETETDIANAVLIASSPVLLEALADLVRYCEENKVGAELEFAKHAIQKATTITF